MATEGKLVDIAITGTGSIILSTEVGVFGEVLEAGQQEFPSVSEFNEALASAKLQIAALLPWIPIILESHKHPGDMNALIALAPKRVVFDTDPGQIPFSFPAV